MKEQRCPHGFMRSMIGCEECGPVKRRRSARKKNGRRPRSEPIEPLEFTMSCRFCRRGCHSPNHANMCAKRIAWLAREGRREWLRAMSAA